MEVTSCLLPVEAVEGLYDVLGKGGRGLIRLNLVMPCQPALIAFSGELRDVAAELCAELATVKNVPVNYAMRVGGPWLTVADQSSALLRLA